MSIHIPLRALVVINEPCTKSNRISNSGSWCISTVIGAFLMAAGSLVGIIRAAGMLHTRLISTVLRFPMSFFDTTPNGRIVSRFSKDIDTVDEQFRLMALLLTFQLASLLVTLIAIWFSTWIFVGVSVVVLAVFVVLQVSITHRGNFSVYNSRKKLHSSPLRARYGVSFVSAILTEVLSF